MRLNLLNNFDASADWFKQLQLEICTTIEQIDGPMQEHTAPTRPGWEQSHRTIYGSVFEKGTVNYSKVTGEFDPKFAKEIPGTEKDSSYQATGISVVLHPSNPKVPAMHFNTRYLSTGIEWYGGGMDYTPCLPFDKESYHAELKQMCDEYDKSYYPDFSKACDEYFYLPHRKETRGIGGLFFEYCSPDTMSFDFVEAVGLKFNSLLHSTVMQNKDLDYTEEDKQIQLVKRGRYVEFNLMYDRGTKFGFKTGGNMDAILMSLPPMVKWN
jgi:coproporphyrinogen III oxidase